MLLMVSFALQKFLSLMMSHLLTVDLSSYTECSVQEVVSFVKAFDISPHFLFYQVQCVWFCVEVFDPLELEFCAG